MTAHDWSKMWDTLALGIGYVLGFWIAFVVWYFLLRPVVRRVLAFLDKRDRS